ncbi:hypothetical protein ACLKA7_011669 [Drosophila subpalustris]
MDETWIHHYIPESNRSSAEWREAGESRSKREKASRWAGEFACTPNADVDVNVGDDDGLGRDSERGVANLTTAATNLEFTNPTACCQSSHKRFVNFLALIICNKAPRIIMIFNNFHFRA